MDIELHEINVTLSKYQKEKICEAFHNRETITLRLKNDALSGSDTLLVPSKKPLKRKEGEILDEATFNNIFKNLTDDERRKLYRTMYYPTIVERLESRRQEEYKGMDIFLDYSLINDLTKDSVTRNIEKLIECGTDCH